MSFENVFDICSVILFWLLVASACDMVLVLGETIKSERQDL